MKDKIIMWFLPIVIEQALKVFSKAQILSWLDEQITRAENHFLKTEYKIDDLLIPVLRHVRHLFNITVKESTNG